MSELHELVCQNDYDRLEDEVKKGKHDVNARDEEWGYRHALHWAAQKGFSECIRLLVEYGAWPYARDYRGWTAAHYAAEAGKLPVLRTLLAVKCPLHHKDKWGMSPYDVALVYGNKECASYIMQSIEEISELRQKFRAPSAPPKKKLSKASRVTILEDETSKEETQQQQSTGPQQQLQLDESVASTEEVFEFDKDDPNWKTFFNLEWGNEEFEGATTNLYIPYLMTGA